MFRLLPRLVLFELIKITMLSFCALVLLIVIGGAMIEASKRGLDPIKIMALMPFLIPPTLPFVLPMSFLFAVTFVYSRMAAHAELVAMRAGGIHLFRMILPALIVSSGLAAGMIALTFEYIPRSNAFLTNLMFGDIRGNLYLYLKTNRKLLIPGFPYELYVFDVRKERLIKPVFIHRNSQGEAETVAYADEAFLDIKMPTEAGQEPLVMVRMEHIHWTKRTISYQNTVEVFPMPIPPLSKQSAEKIENLTVAQCENVANAMEGERFAWEHRLAVDAFQDTMGGRVDSSLPFPLCEQMLHREHCTAQMKESLHRREREARGEKHVRLVQSLGVFVFALIGCPVGILFQRRDFLHTFFICFLPILIVFYPSLVLSFNIFKEGAIDSPAVLWTPIILLTLVSIPLNRRAIWS